MESYEFDEKLGYISVVEIEDEKTLRIFGTNYYSFDILTGEKNQLTYLDRKNKSPDSSYTMLDNYIEKGSVKPRINNGYTAVQRVRSIFINHERRLCINKHELVISSHLNRKGAKITVNLNIYKGDFLEDRAAEIQGIEHLIPENKRLKFRRAVWPDGSSAVFDPRGFVHLKSSDPDLPEITIAMILQKETACWSSDGKFCGSPYLYKPTLVDKIDCDEFNLKYIQPFIDKIL